MDFKSRIAVAASLRVTDLEADERMILPRPRDRGNQ